MAVIRDTYQLEVDTGGAQRSITGLSTSLKGLGFAAVGAAAVAMGRQIVAASKEFEVFNNQLKLITDSQEELTATMDRLRQVAIDNRAAFGDTVDLFTKLTLSTQDLGISQERVLAVTGKFQQALAISGADANTAAGAIRQFGQAMASGTVRGDEFNSIVEALGPALSIMAQESGLSVGKLREMSQAGELTAETFFEIVESSNALTAAFNSTTATTEQLETALGDAFKEVLVDVDKAIGLTEKYRGLLIGVTDILRDLAGNTPKLEDLLGAEQFARALENVERQIASNEQALKQMIDVPFNDSYEQLEANLEALKAQRDEILANVEAQEAKAEVDKAAADAIAEQVAATNAITGSLSQYNDVLKTYASIDPRSEVEKLTDAQEEARVVIDALMAAQQELNLSTESGRAAFADISLQIDDAKTAFFEYGKQLDEIQAKSQTLSSMELFYNDLIEGSRAAVTEQTNAMLAQDDLREALESGKISVDVYAAAMERVNGILGISTESTNKLADAQKALKDTVDQVTEASQLRVQAAEDDALLENLSGLDRQLKEIEITELRIAEAAKRRVLAQAQEAGLDTAAIQDDLARINAARDEAIARQQELATATYEQQRAFSTGWKNAFDEYVDEATNAAKQGERLFATMSKGIEDSFVSFAKTGKFEVKDLLATIAEEILRSGIRRLVAQLFGNSLFGGTQGGGLFAGGFANGGMIPSGQFGLVGERGPELISGPAQITPLNNISGGGVTNVSYNINAVDAQSFKSMVARDPAFLYAVTEKGRRSVPQTRR